MSTALWASQQQSLAIALLDPHAATPECLAVRVGTATDSRFDVYRNNVHSSLIDALVAAFPVAARLVSAESFRALAREYLRQELPAGAALHDYGAGLPAFIRAWEPATALPYLADVAALEHAWWQSYGAGDASVLSLRELATLNPEQLFARRVLLHPATRLLRSVHPVHGIWAAHQSDAEPAPPASWQPECVLLTRPEAQVQVRAMNAAQYSLLDALAAGATLEAAASVAIEIDPDFDLGATLQLAIEAGAIQELC